MHISLNDVVIKEGYHLENLDVYTNGYFAGYITCSLVDETNDRKYDTLYRIHDTDNGNDYILVTVDYGWEVRSDAIINKAEEVLTEVAKKLNINFEELEEAQIEYRLENK